MLIIFLEHNIAIWPVWLYTHKTHSAVRSIHWSICTCPFECIFHRSDICPHKYLRNKNTKSIYYNFEKFKIKDTPTFDINTNRLISILSQMQRIRPVLRTCVPVRHKQTEPPKEDVSGTPTKPASIYRSASASRLVDEFIRVDHAGELGADRIYAGQMAVLGMPTRIRKLLKTISLYLLCKSIPKTHKGHTPVGPTIHHMWEQEKEHRIEFERLIGAYRVRPTVMTPLWHIAGFALGAGTALLGEKAAMACTVAVETVIVEHYNDQLRQLMEEPIVDQVGWLAATIILSVTYCFFFFATETACNHHEIPQRRTRSPRHGHSARCGTGAFL